MRESPGPPLLRLSKIDAARRQIESAIWLWFLDADIVSVHTLTAAAHRILTDLAEQRGVNPLPFTKAYLPTRHEKEASRRFRDAEAFFKHAKNAETYGFDEIWIELYLFDAVMAYAHLFDNNDSGSALMSTFVVRFGVQRPDLFAPNVFPLLEDMFDKSFNIERLQNLSKIEFLKEFFDFLGQSAH